MKSSKQASQSQITAALIAILLIIGATAFAWYWMQNQAPLKEESQTGQKVALEPTKVPTPTPTPRPIPHGKWGFGVSTSQRGPQLGRGYLDPYDPAYGAKQIITLYASDDKAVQSVRATIKTDTKVHQPIEFTRINGSDLGGEWQGSWTVDDTYLYTYSMVFEAQSQNGKTQVESTFR